MRITEQFIKGKRDDRSLCEDGLYIGDGFIAVIDGVTSKGRQKWQGKYSSGGYAKNIIADALETMPADTGRQAFFEALDSALNTAYNKEVVNDCVTEYLRACIIVYSRHYSEIWALGDCQCMINGVVFDNSKKIDTLLSDLRAFVIECAEKDGSFDCDDDIGRKAIVPFLERQLEFENDTDSDFGYGVLNGHGVDMRFVKSYAVKAGDTVVLASDGYPGLFDTLEKSERELERLLKSDPMCCKENRGTKGISRENCSFDDRTYIKFEV